MAKWTLTDEEFERQLAQADRRSAEPAPNRAIGVRYDARNAAVQVDLASGASLMVPTRVIEGIEGADEALLSQVALTPLGDCIRWDAIDVELEVAAMLEGIFGSRAWMERLQAKRPGSAA